MEGALFQQYPFESIQLFRKTILFGALCAFCTTIPTMYYLNKSWDSEAMCDRILRVYHCFRILLFVGQFYPRTVIYRKLTDVNEQRHLGREIVIEHLLLLLHTKEWRINQFIGVVVYSFFAIALTSLFFFPDCYSESPALFRLCLLNMFVFVAHIIVTYAWVKHILQRQDPLYGFAAASGASTAMIEERTKLVKFTGQSDQDDPNNLASCRICFAHYMDGDTVRILPCAHNYHPACIDPWLETKKLCPLCHRSIDTVQDDDDPTNVIPRPVVQFRHDEKENAQADGAADDREIRRRR